MATSRKTRAALAANPPLADGKGLLPAGTPLCGRARGKQRGNLTQDGQSGTCAKKAGAGTNHPGTGACYLHGGNAGRKPKPAEEHSELYKRNQSYPSRYVAIEHPTLTSLVAKFGSDPDYMALNGEVALLRAVLTDYVNRYYEQTEALLAWHGSFNDGWSPMYGEWLDARDTAIAAGETPPPPPDPARAPGKPRQIVDIASVSKMLTDVGALVTRIHQIETEGAITLVTLGEILLDHQVGFVQGAIEVIEDADLLGRLTNAVEKRWQAIKVDPRMRRSRERGARE